MRPTGRTPWVLFSVVAVGILLVLACSKREPVKDEAHQREAQLQAQLEAEQIRRAGAEQAARDAERSRDSWISGLGAAAIVGSVVAGLVGIHIGSRAIARYRKEHPHGP